LLRNPGRGWSFWPYIPHAGKVPAPTLFEPVTFSSLLDYPPGRWRVGDMDWPTVAARALSMQRLAGMRCSSFSSQIMPRRISRTISQMPTSEFRGKTLGGQAEQKVRWKRAVLAVAGGDFINVDRFGSFGTMAFGLRRCPVVGRDDLGTLRGMKLFRGRATYAL
jgi:hypothetical protein